MSAVLIIGGGYALYALAMWYAKRQSRKRRR